MIYSKIFNSTHKPSAHGTGKKLLMMNSPFVHGQSLRGTHPKVRKYAFTLVELLVVIGIIGLLISILLPVLGQARHSARAVVCASNLRQVGLGLQLYASENQGWIPGPNTTGRSLHFGGAYGGDSSSPVQDWDWASPIVGKMLNLPKQQPGENEDVARMAKFRLIMEQKLRCPENEFTYGTQYATGGPALPGNGLPIIMSYTTPGMFHLLPAANHSALKEIIEDTGTSNNVQLPRSYVPKMNKVGPASNKIFAYDGARYWDPSKNWFDFCTDKSTVGFAGRPQGAFNSRGIGLAYQVTGEPYLFDSVSRTNLAASKPAMSYRMASLRHNGKLQAVYFDGHVELLSIVDAGALEPWVPKGTKHLINCFWDQWTGNYNRYPINMTLP